MKGHNYGICLKCEKQHIQPSKGKCIWTEHPHPTKGKRIWTAQRPHPKGMLGHKHSETTKEKMHISFKGINKGRKRPDLSIRNKSIESRLNLSAKLKGRKHTPEHIRKVAMQRCGEKQSEETIKKRLATYARIGLYEKHAKRLRENPIGKYCKSPSKPQRAYHLLFKHLFSTTPVFCNRQVPKKDEGNYYLDIAIPQYKLNIEYDGLHWHQKTKERDAIRDNYLKSIGWQIIRIEGK